MLLTMLLFPFPMLRAVESDERVMLIPWTKAPKESPVFFSATAEVKARVGLESITSEQKISYRVHQGKAETLTLGLSGAGEVTEVTGTGLRDWSVRVAADGKRFLDLRPNELNGIFPTELEVLVKTRQKIVQESAALLLPAPADATGFSISIRLAADPGVVPGQPSAAPSFARLHTPAKPANGRSRGRRDRSA